MDRLILYICAGTNIILGIFLIMLSDKTEVNVVGFGTQLCVGGLILLAIAMSVK